MILEISEQGNIRNHTERLQCSEGSVLNTYKKVYAHSQNFSSSNEERQFMPEHFISLQGHECLETLANDRILRVLLKPILELYLFLARLKNKKYYSTFLFISYILYTIVYKT